MVRSAAMTATDIHRTIAAVWRIESAKLIASLARMVRDVGIAEELAQDALVAAIEHGRSPAFRIIRALG
jgi:predicted RNA polymerase sigma factor